MVGAGIAGVLLLLVAVGGFVGRRLLLERVRGLAQARLAAALPGAQLGQVELLGLQLRVTGTMLPLTEGLTLWLEHVTVDGLLGALRGGAGALRVVAARGSLNGTWLKDTVVNLVLETRAPAQLVDGVLQASFNGVDGQAVALTAAVTAGLDGARAKAQTLQGEPLPLELVASASAADGWTPQLDVRFADTPVGALAAAARLLLGARLPALPALTLRGSVGWRSGGVGQVDLEVRGEGIQGRASGRVTSDGVLEETQLTATADAEKLEALFGLKLSDAVALGSTVTLEGQAHGPWRHPQLKARAQGLSVTFRPDASQLVALEEISLELEGVVHALKASATASLAGIPLNAQGMLHPWPRPEAHNAMLVLETQPMDAALLGLVVAVLRGGGMAGAPALPAGATVALELTVEHDGRGAGRVHVRSGGSHVVLEPHWEKLSHGLTAQVQGKLELHVLVPNPYVHGTVDVDGRVEWNNGAWTAEGWCGAPSLHVMVPGAAHPLVLDQVRAEARATPLRVELTSFQAMLAGGAVRGQGTAWLQQGADANRLRCVLEPMPAHAVAGLLKLVPGFPDVTVELARQVRPLNHIWIPQDLTLGLELTVPTQGATVAVLDLRTPRTAVSGTLRRAEDGTFLDSPVRGRLAFVDALSLGMFTAAVRPAPMGAVQLEAQLTGTLSAPCITGTAVAPEAALQLSDDMAFPRPVFQDVDTQFSVDLAQTRWSVTAKRAYGGSAKAGGLVGYGGSFVGLRTTVDVEGVDVSRVPTQLDGTAQLEGLLGGHLTAHLKFNRAGPPGAVLTAQGELRLDDPEFPVVTHARQALSRFGLAPPPPGGTRPVLCTVALTGNTLRLNGLEAGLNGVEVTGSVAVNVDSGVLDGGIKATLDPDFLSQSTLLSFPAVMNGSVTIPIHVRGTLQHPDVGADTASVLGQFVTGNKVVRGVSDAISDLAGAFGFGGGSSSRTKVPTQEDIDRENRRYDHVLKNDKDDDDEFLQKLLDSGLSADEIASVLGRKPKPRR